MKAQQTLLQHAARYAASNNAFVHVLILAAYGSTSRRAASLLLSDDGEICGTIGGGALEAQVIAEAQAILSQGVAITERTIEVQEGLGSVTLLFLLHLPSDPTTELYCHFAAWEEQQRFFTLGVQLEPSFALFAVANDRSSVGEPSAYAFDTAQLVLRDKVPRLISEPAFRCYYDLPVCKQRLLLVGGGHVNQAIAHLASFIGLTTVVVETRPDFATEALFPCATERIVQPTLTQALRALTLDSDTYAVVANHLLDTEAVAFLLEAKIAYVGVLGSHYKAKALYEQFGRVETLHVPMGLQIGAESPEEIAISVLAELLAHKNGCKPHSLREPPLCDKEKN